MRIVVKAGSSTLTYSTGRLNIRRVENLVKVLSDLRNAGHEVIFVSSGAIAMGVGKLGLRDRPDDIPGKQAAAAVGQCELMYTYDKLFSVYNHNVAQILLTAADIEDEYRHMNFKNTMLRLLNIGAIPIINENDSVATDEIVIGDNDTLAAVVAASVSADVLVLITDTGGLYTADPHRDPSAELIREIREITPEILAIAEGAGSDFGTGGMHTKLHAAEIATQAGIDMIIMNRDTPEKLYEIVDGLPVGTRFIGRNRD